MITALDLFNRLKNVRIGVSSCLYTMDKCKELVPLINEINLLKKETNATLLVHSYVSPEVVYGVADFVGDSYKLSKDAIDSGADTIVFVAVRFMAETAKILNPAKQVLIPSQDSGCTLADAITAEKVRELREQYPDFVFVCYINTTAEVKAECDVCVTSSNVYHIVETIDSDKIYFLPDKLMGENLRDDMKRRGVDKTIEIYNGTCYVHEEYDPEMLDYIRMEYPGVQVVSHPECSPSIVKKSDFVGSTSQIVDHVKNDDNDKYLMLTECGLSARLQVEMPQKQLVGSCTMCRYMKSNSLEDILRVLRNPEEKDMITLDENIRLRAKKCIDKMFAYVG
ncbi:quinolinate synthase [PVC group bacterium (ex Bugula neritina AB1)]|nr:quinolinate synthase [PVC group bacterium (ex Bugula neritina AB1)]